MAESKENSPLPDLDAESSEAVPSKESQLEESQLEESQLEESQLEESQLEESQLEESQLEESQLEESQLDTASSLHVGRWHQLVSTTNWEKGRIIWQWRRALKDAGANVDQYSDEAWALRVGGVTGQHVGRLRRVFRRFGESFEGFAGLYWSHFCAALDWEDAEMWLEGAVQNRWSVSRMRHQRWETLGQVDAVPHDGEIISGELDEDFVSTTTEGPVSNSADRSRGSEAYDGPLADAPDFGDEPAPGALEQLADLITGGIQDEPKIRPLEHLPELPNDLADAFEAFKLAVLRHKATGWEAVSIADIEVSLDALRQLLHSPQ